MLIVDANCTRVRERAKRRVASVAPREASGRQPARRGDPGEPRLGRDGEHLELLVGGISYSSFHPERPWTGYVWDALAACVLLAPFAAPRVLLLGAGAGTVLQLMRRLRPRAELLAVELDARVIALARQRFRLDATRADVVQGDALAHLQRTRRRFHVLLDDMYGPAAGGLARPVADEEAHLRLLASRLLPDGVAATNVTTDDDPPGLLRCVRRAYAAVFPHRLEVRPPRGHNLVVVGSFAPLRPAAVRGGLAALPDHDREGVRRLALRRA
jgi:predicted membrane-bound spermidine synthase